MGAPWPVIRTCSGSRAVTGGQDASCWVRVLTDIRKARRPEVSFVLGDGLIVAGGALGHRAVSCQDFALLPGR